MITKPLFGTILGLLFLAASVVADLLRADSSETEGKRGVIVVASADFDQALEPWINYRRQLGYAVYRITEPTPEPEGGNPLLGSEGGQNRPFASKGNSEPPSPVRIREKIRQIAAKNSVEAILIIGNGAPNHGESENNDAWRRIIPAPRVPAAVIDRFGPEKHIASDSWFADLDDDGFPELAVGRIPARTGDELAPVVRKIIAYETEIPPGPWQRKIDFVAGIGGFSPILDNVIQREVRKTLNKTLPGSLDIFLTQADWKSPYCPDPKLFRFTVIDRINQGPLFWVYMGHGSHQSLDYLRTPVADFRIFEWENVGDLDCPAGKPILFFFACYTGAYDAGEESLAEEISLRPNGPVAVLAASRTSMPYGMGSFGVELIEEAFTDNRPKTLGGMILAAKRRMVPLLPPSDDSTVVPPLDDSTAEENDISGQETDDSTAEKGKSDTKSASPAPQDAEEISPNEKRRREVRLSLDQTARTFDPTGKQLDRQLMDHVQLFNLFGDPLLRVRLPEQISFQAPEKTLSGETITVSGRLVSLTGSAVVTVELAYPMSRRSVKMTPRKTVTPNDLNDTSRIEWQKTFEAANRRVISSVTGRTAGEIFSVSFPIPPNLNGSFLLRILVEDGGELKIGSRPIVIR